MTTVPYVPDADPIERRLATDAVLARLQTLTGVTVYDAEVPTDPPLITHADGTVDAAQRVAPYVVLFPLPGAPSADGDLADTDLDLVITWQIDAAAGYRRDLEHLIDRVDALLRRWAPAVDGCTVSGLRHPIGFAAGAIRPATAATPQPPRFWLPLQYQTHITR